MPLTQEVSAAFFDHTTDTRPPKPRLFAQTRQIASCKPLIASDLTCVNGHNRSVFLLKVPARDLCRDGLWILQDTTTIAEIDPLALQSPMVDPYALLTGLSHDGSLRLLRLFLTTGVSLFGMGTLAGFRDIISQLLDQLAPSELALRAWCPVSKSGAIVSYDIPRALTEQDVCDLVALTDTGVVRMSGTEADIETKGDDRVLHLFLPDGIAPGATLIALGDTPLRLSGPAEGQSGRPLGVWLGRRSQKIRNQTKARLTRLAAQDDIAAALLDELSCPQADLPKATPHLLARTPNGLFYVIGLADPYQLASAIVLRDQDGECEVPLAKPCHHPRLGRVHVGFHTLPQGSAPGDDVEFGVLYRSGRLSSRTQARLDALPTSLPAIVSELSPTVVARPLAQALADTLPLRRAPKTEHVIVAEPETPADVTIVLDLAETPELAYALAASLNARRDVELLLTHPDRRRRTDAQSDCA